MSASYRAVSTLALIGVGSSVLMGAEVHLRIAREAKLLGYATMSQRVLPAGGKLVEMRMELNGPTGRPTQLHKTSTYDPLGRPVRMVLEVNSAERTETIATFDERGAHLSRMIHGFARISDVPRAENSPWTDASEFWFLRDTPKPGDQVRTLLFSANTLDWVLTKITYLGKQIVTSGGRSVSANAVQTDADGKSSVAFLDEHGDPIRLELDDGVVMSTMASSATKAGGG